MMDTEHSLRFNNNSYLSIGIVVLIIVATIWIKDGQSSVTSENKITSSELVHYIELQAKDAEILKGKIDNLTELVKSSATDRWTGKDARRTWEEFQRLNPQLKIILPSLPPE